MGWQNPFPLFGAEVRGGAKGAPVPEAFSPVGLLARKSSIIRHLALFEQSPGIKHSRFEASLRCAEKARLKNESAPTILEEGIANWSFARYEHTDEGYVTRLRKAESCFTHSLLQNDELALLTLSRFYRLTYQPLKACDVFPRTSEITISSSLKDQTRIAPINTTSIRENSSKSCPPVPERVPQLAGWNATAGACRTGHRDLGAGTCEGGVTG